LAADRSTHVLPELGVASHSPSAQQLRPS
jgi:hypothetical protein